jgi:hypothetical protein
MENKILIQKNFTGYNAEYITFRTGSSYQDVVQLYNNTFNYNSDFPIFTHSSIYSFYEALFLGRELPNIMIFNDIGHYSNLLAACLFLYKKDVFSVRTLEIVSYIDKIERFGSIGFISIPEHLSKILFYLNTLLTSIDSDDSYDRILRLCVSVLHGYLDMGDVVNVILDTPNKPVILKKWGDEFILAEIQHMIDIDILYTYGFKNGLCFLNGELIFFMKPPFCGKVVERLSKKIITSEMHVQKLDNFLIISSLVRDFCTSHDKDFIISICDRFYNT